MHMWRYDDEESEPDVATKSNIYSPDNVQGLKLSRKPQFSPFA